jgi:hypothetical protein
MITQKGKILIVDDDPDVLLSAKLLLNQHFLQISTLDDPEGLTQLLKRETIDVLLLDMNFTRDTADDSCCFCFGFKKGKKDNPSPGWSFQERFYLTASTPFAKANFGALSGRLHTRQGCTLRACFHRIAATGRWVQTRVRA